MESTHGHQEGHGHEGEHSFDKKAIWRTFWLLLGITCVELIVGMFIAPHFPERKIMFNILYIILTGAKAFYIIAEFMHLKYEIKNLIMTIGIPALLFVWFIAAFLWDGGSYLHLRNKYDAHHAEDSRKPVSGSEHGGHEGQKPGTVH